MSQRNFIIVLVVVLLGLGLWYVARTPSTQPAVTHTDADEGVPPSGSGPRTPGMQPPP